MKVKLSIYWRHRFSRFKETNAKEFGERELENCSKSAIPTFQTGTLDVLESWVLELLFKVKTSKGSKLEVKHGMDIEAVDFILGEAPTVVKNPPNCWKVTLYH